MATDLIALRARLINAIEALEAGDVAQYTSILALGQHAEDPLVMSAVREVFKEMGITETRLYTWYGRYSTWCISNQIAVLRQHFR